MRTIVLFTFFGTFWTFDPFCFGVSSLDFHLCIFNQRRDGMKGVTLDFVCASLTRGGMKEEGVKK
jgi:hypothetical protein